MKIFVNQKVRSLFIQLLLCILAVSLCQTLVMFLGPERKVFYNFLWVPGMGIMTLFFCYRYFREQNEIMEDAVIQIREYISGDRDRRISCNDEGELYRLFHEVNSLAAILNAKAENERRMRKFLKNIIADISHQLKTPLAALNIYNGIIQAEALENDLSTVKEFSDLSDLELERLQTLVQNLLKIAKFDAGEIVIEKHQEKVSEIMEDVKSHFAFRTAEEGKEIVLAGDEKLSLFCDRNWIVEAVDNIVKNALDHMAEGDVVSVEWGQSISALWVRIKDNGSGIHPEDLHHIFKRFYRSRYSKDKQGIGLGLPLAKSVVEAHNGTIKVESLLGHGTTFLLNFLIPTKL